MKKKTLIAGLFLLVVCVSISAVSADINSYSSSESSNSNGNSITFDNGKLVIQGIEFAIPDGYKEVDKGKKLGIDSKALKGFKESSDTFTKGNDRITIKVSYNNTTEEYTPASNTVEKTISNQTGWFIEDNAGAVFTYIKDKKIVEILAPDEQTLASIIK